MKQVGLPVTLRRPLMSRIPAPLLAGLLLIAFALNTGCGARYPRVEPVPPDKSATRRVRVALLPLEDVRVKDDRNPRLHLIPLVPFDSLRKSQFDVAFKSTVNFWPDVIQQKLATEFKRRDAFEVVEFTKSMSNAETFPLVVRGKLELAEQRGLRYSYGVSFLAKYLWYIGLPRTSRHWNVRAQFEVYETVDGRSVWASEPLELRTSTRFLTVYHDDLSVEPVLQAFDRLAAAAASEIQRGLPEPRSGFYADLNKRHETLLATRALQEERQQGRVPPDLLISRPRTDIEVRTPQTEVAWTADAVAGLREVKILRNGQEIPLPNIERQIAAATGPSDAPRRLTEDTPVPLELGRNIIRLQVTDFLDQTVNRQIAVDRLPERLFEGRRFAVLVGVSEYASPDLPPGLPGAKWARELAEFLQSDFGGQMSERDIAVLTNDQATLDAVRSAIGDAVRQAVSTDSIFIYFSGYSLAVDTRGPGYLLTYESNPDNLAETALSVAELQQILQDSLAQNTIMFSDAGFPLASYELNAQEILANMTRRLRNVSVISSARSAQSATPVEAGRMTFSELLVTLLEGNEADYNNDGTITIRELIDKLIEESTARGLSIPSEAGRYDRELPMKKLE